MQDYKTKSIVLLQGVFGDKVIADMSFNKETSVFVMEGRPSFEAAQSTCKSLLKRGITPTLISDNMAGYLFYKNWIKRVVLACQTVDATGSLCDTGALIVAILAKKNKIPIKLAQAKNKIRFLGDPASVAPKGVNGYVPLVEWVSRKYLT